MEKLTSVEAFEAMRSFVAQFAARVPVEGREPFRELLRWSGIEADSATSDPAQWHDWERSVTEARLRLAAGEPLTIP